MNAADELFLTEMMLSPVMGLSMLDRLGKPLSLTVLAMVLRDVERDPEWYPVITAAVNGCREKNWVLSFDALYHGSEKDKLKTSMLACLNTRILKGFCVTSHEPAACWVVGGKPGLMEFIGEAPSPLMKAAVRGLTDPAKGTRVVPELVEPLRKLGLLAPA